MDKYHRQKIVPGFGNEGQDKLARSRVLVVGCGGLGCPALVYLARAGVGELIIVDDDKVSETNLHRQILFDIDDVGKSKAVVAKRKLKASNKDIKISCVETRVGSENIHELMDGCDVVLDGSDNFETKYLTNSVCLELKIPMIYGAVNRFDGQLAVFNLPQSNASYSLNMNDLFPVKPSVEELGSCELNGVIGPVAGLVGQMMAIECIKIITGIGTPLVDKLMMIDTQNHRYHFMAYHKQDIRDAVKLTGELSWKEYRENYGGIDNIQLVDVRTVEERMARNQGGVHIDVNSQDIEELKPTVVQIFYCETGVRARRAQMRFLAKSPDAEAYFISGQLPG